MQGLMWPFALLFRLIVGARNFFYNIRLLPRKKVACPVVSLGNLSVGGTGKTPWTVHLIEKLKAKNIKVVVVSRGYKGNFSGVLQVDNSMRAEQCGDEPLMIHQRTGCPVYVGVDRYQAASEAIKKENPQLILLDDGFQHRRLHRDLDIVIFDATWPAWKYDMLPKGRLREPVSSLRRADVCVLNKWNLANSEQTSFIESLLGRSFAKGLVLISQYEFKSCLPQFSQLHQELERQKTCLVCGIAAPETFVKVVRDHGLEPVDTYFYPDHHNWNTADVEEILRKTKFRGCRDLLVTEKDKVKLKNFAGLFEKHSVQMWVFQIEITVLNDEDALLKKIEGLIGEPS